MSNKRLKMDPSILSIGERFQIFSSYFDQRSITFVIGLCFDGLTKSLSPGSNPGRNLMFSKIVIHRS